MYLRGMLGEGRVTLIKREGTVGAPPTQGPGKAGGRQWGQSAVLHGLKR